MFGREVETLVNALTNHTVNTAMSAGIFTPGAATVFLSGSENMVQALSRMKPRPIPGQPLQNANGTFPLMKGYDVPYSTT